ncbi:unnamed protein product [Linum trigynum]|uniref:CCHC-type domain-containing protein n=1 Tax=Linum trigynum TaxID=586398 RepID=A0AAV2D7N5_9ROSI
MDLNNETFLVTFNNDQDYLVALTGGPWVILDHYLLVHQWTPSFRSTDKPHRSVVAWVLFPELPVHFYHREVLFAIGNLIGRTVKLDYHTETLQRGKFARIAIELDMTKPLPTKVYLDGASQQVVYENLPQICYDCGRIGHMEDHCPQRAPVQELALAIAPGDGATLMIPSENTSSEPPSGYGPWMQVTRKSRKPTKNKGGNSANLPFPNGMDSGKLPPKSGGKGKGETSKGVILADSKGKKEAKEDSKKGMQSNQKGKAELRETEASNGKKKTNGNQEWRAKDMPNRQPLQTKVTAGQDSSTAQAKAQASTSSPSASQEVVLGPNNTKIHTLALPSLAPNQKENTDPNSNRIKSRQRSQKQSNDSLQNQGQSKGVNLKATKKPLQILSSKKKESPKKLINGGFPITLKAIEEFYAHTQSKAQEFQNIISGKPADVDMAETSSANPIGVQADNLNSQGDQNIDPATVA